MAWDLQINLQTGDLVFNSILDLSASTAEALIQQRIHVRLMVERGSFIYDDSGTLGSRLNSLLRMGVPKAAANLEMMIREALAPMTDITVTDVIVNIFGDGSNKVTDPRQALATIKYELVLAENAELSPNIPSELQTQVALPG